MQAAAVAAVEEVEPTQVDGAEAGDENKPKAKAKASSLRKKVVEELASRSVEEVIQEQRAIYQKAEATIAEIAALEGAKNTQVEEMQAGFDKARSAVEAAIAEEKESANALKALKQKKENALESVEEARKELLEAQKKVSMLEVMAANHRRVKELEKARKEATAAAAAAKEDLARQKANQKAALEATRKELEAARQAAKGLGKGKHSLAAKRPPAPSPTTQPSPKRASPGKAAVLPTAAPQDTAEDPGEDIE